MNERGIALVVAIFALVVIGALVAGTFLIGRLEQRAGASTVYATQAGEAADAGLTRALEEDQSVYDGMTVWTPANAAVSELALATDTMVGGSKLLRSTVTVRRLNQTLFLVRSVGQRLGMNGSVLAADERGLMLRLEKANVVVNAAITVMQPIKLNGNTFAIDGRNNNPPGWETADATNWKAPCPPTDAGTSDDKVGIRSASSTGMSGKDGALVNGYPSDSVAFDPTITSATFRDFVDKTFSSMTKQNGVKALPLTTPYNSVGPVVSGGVCDKSSPYNFGEPTHPSSTAAPCYTYFPIVNGTGSQTKFAAGSRGQGTLLIEGDLEINGGFEWTGLIIVRGSFKINGNGNKITGAVLAESVTNDNTIGGNVEIKYSDCAIKKAIQGASTASPLNERSWLQLY